VIFEPFHDKAVVLKLDNSVTSMPINGARHVMSNGMNLLDPANPIWGGEEFTTAWSEL
jgi:hypothetical protein